MRGERLPIHVLVAVIMCCSWCQVQGTNAWDPGENGPEKVNRLDSGLDKPMKVTLYNPHPSPTKLFAQCLVSHKAFVRFRELVFPAQDVKFTRYVPLAAQLALYNTSWRVVNDSSLKTSLACASYAKQNGSVLMYQFIGSKCRVSTVRMPMEKQTCGNKKATAVFIRASSCPAAALSGGTVSLGFRKAVISWTADDTCSSIHHYKVTYLGSEFITTDSTTSVTIPDLAQCDALMVTIDGLDSSGSSVVQAPISASFTTTTNCRFLNVCYGCLEFPDVVRGGKAAAEDACTSIGFKLYRPADAAEVADLIAFLAAKYGSGSNSEGKNLCVDLAYANSKWTWAGAAAVDETLSSNWVVSHPNSAIGECAVLSVPHKFKLKSVDCAIFPYSLCIRSHQPMIS